ALVARGTEDPSECSFEARPELAYEGAVPRPPQVLGEEHDEERGGIHRAVVGNEGNLAARRHLPAAELVEAAPGLLGGKGVVMSALVSSEEPQRPPCDLRLEGQELEGRDEAVTPEGSDVPRDAGVGHGAGRGFRYQHVDIASRASQPATQAFMGG